MEGVKQSWAEPLPGEPAVWFARFCRWRDLGEGRSLAALTRLEKGLKRQKGHKVQPPGRWNEMIKKWRWHERVAEMTTARGAAALAECEAQLKRERDAQHRILAGVQELQLRLIGGDEEALTLAIGRLAKINELAPWFELGDKLFKTLHGEPAAEGAPAAAGAPTVSVVFLPAHVARPRLERAGAIEVETKVEHAN
ncbi:MAG: hypothetical protein LBK60_01420 [Verrucomicrobiales bacterium]|jgi:hypothetical protein|nr:hypothetical protein [Verrucomicrobiales bacterium]